MLGKNVLPCLNVAILQSFHRVHCHPNQPANCCYCRLPRFQECYPPFSEKSLPILLSAIFCCAAIKTWCKQHCVSFILSMVIAMVIHISLLSGGLLLLGGPLLSRFYGMTQILQWKTMPLSLPFSKFVTQTPIIRLEELRQTFVVRVVMCFYCQDGHKTYNACLYT